MKKYLQQPVLQVKGDAYLSLLTFLAPLLNFLPGLNMDMYAPSMPAIASHYSTTATMVKNTITLTVLGMAVGSLLFGLLMDAVGRKKMLIFSLFVYMLASFLAIWTVSINQLLLIRFIQGAMIVGVSVGCRVLIIDSMQGHRYQVAIIYTSLVSGFAPIIGPFIGGVLQHYFGWQSNFIFFAIVSFILLTLLILFIQESLLVKQSLSLSNIVAQYFNVIKHKYFMTGVVIAGLVQVELTLYALIGPFIVENLLHKNAIVYGNSALVVGVGYFSGVLINRLLLRYLPTKRICYYGFCLLFIAVAAAYLFALISTLNLISLMLPLIMMSAGNGFIYPNILGTNLRFFAQNAGVAMATQVCLSMLFAAIGLFLLSHIVIKHLPELAYIYTAIIGLQAVIYFKIYSSQIA